MKRLLSILLFLIAANLLYGQTNQITNTRVSLSQSLDSLIVTYELIGEAPFLDIQLEITDSVGNRIPAKTVTGDVGYVLHPTNKLRTIYWNMREDNAAVYGKTIYAMVTSDVLLYKEVVQVKVQECICYFPWLLIASGLSAATGGYAWYMANESYNKYLTADQTIPAERHRRDVLEYETIRNYAFGAAAIFGVAGTYVHIRYKKRKNALKMLAYPTPDGGNFSITYNF